MVCKLCRSETNVGINGLCDQHPQIIVNKSGDIVCWSTLVDGAEFWTNMDRLAKPDPAIVELNVKW